MNYDILVISDIHLGKSMNSTIDIINNLKTYFTTNSKLFNKLSMICITGDTFDRLLPANSSVYHAAIS